MRKQTVVVETVLALSLTGCGYNSFQTDDEKIKVSWSEVVNNTGAGPTWSTVTQSCRPSARWRRNAGFHRLVS